MTSISLENVVASYRTGFSGRTIVLDDLSLEIVSGQLVAVVGPSGCGKTTLLRVIAGLKRVNSGKVRFDGEEMSAIAPRFRNLAMVFQSDAMYSHLDVGRNLAFGEWLRRGSGKASKRVDRRGLNSTRIQTAAKRLGIDGLLDRMPFQLSGGERQRVALGRTLVRDPAAFLLDEPFSGIDAVGKDNLRTYVKERQREKPTTMVLVTHHQDDALLLADSIVVMKNGRIRQAGTPDEIYDHPLDSFVASFFGRPAINMLEAGISCESGSTVVCVKDIELRVDADSLIEINLKGSATKETRVMLGIRPEDIRISRRTGGGPSQFVLPAKIVENRRVGPYRQVQAELLNIKRLRSDATSSDATNSDTPLRLTAFLDKATDIGSDRDVSLSVDPEKIHFFDINSGRNIRQRKTE